MFFSSKDWLQKKFDSAGNSDFTSTVFTQDQLTVQIASSSEQIDAAYRLVYREYSRRNYCPPNESQVYYTPFCFLPETQTFILEKTGKIFGTISLIPDSFLGLPLDSDFKDEADEIRTNPGSNVCEISLLAIDGRLRMESRKGFAHLHTSPSFFLFKSLFTFARKQGVTDLLITVLERQERLYQNMGFRTLGRPRSYQGACGTKAIALTLNIPEWLATVPAADPFKSYFLS